MALSQEELWTTIIENYSLRNITLAGDRLPALAGIARELQVVWSDTYVAGLWRKCLIKHLVWYDKAKFPPVRQPSRYNCRTNETEYQSPGWSWATYHRPVSLFKMTLEDAELKDFGVRLISDQAAFSGVVDGWISLRGNLGNTYAIKDFRPDSFRLVIDDIYEGYSIINGSNKVLLLGCGKDKIVRFGLLLQPSRGGT
jgi:hypothetical protein